MRIPINWLKDYVELPFNIRELGERLTMVGHMFDKVEKNNNETIIDLELRGNRADCYSIIGIAREISAIYEKPLLLPKIFKTRLKKVENLKEIKLKIKSELVKRLMMVVIRDVKNAPSPDWMKDRLKAYGIPSINNIVDTTNYVMVETGEPMHAFDLDSLGKEIEIRLAKPGETLTTFEGTKLTFTKEDLIFANKKSPLSVAGAIGGKDFSINSLTKSILVEAANYERANIRRTCRRHNLMTEAGLRHEKELDPNLVFFAMLRFLELIKENNCGTIEPEILDFYPEPRKEITLSLNYENLEKIGGLKIDRQVAKKIIESLYFSIKKEDLNQIIVSVPTFRTDVVEEADLIEEVLRIYGYEKIPAQTLALEIPNEVTLPEIRQEERFRNSLVPLGFDEVISSAFVYEKDKHSNLSIDNSKDLDPVLVTNPPSPDFEMMRISLLPNLLAFTKKVGDERGERAQFFEIGKIYFKDKKNYLEKRKLGIIYWQKEKINFFDFKGYLEALLSTLGIKNFDFKESKNPVFIEHQFEISISNSVFAYGGKAKNDNYFVEIDLDSLLGQEQVIMASFWPKFPPIIEDLSFEIINKTPIRNIIDIIFKTSSVVKNIQLISSFGSTSTLRIVYSSPHKTLSEIEVKQIREKYLKTIYDKFNISIRTK